MKQRRKTYRRGRTRPERAKLLDAVLPGLLDSADQDLLFVDVGYGDEPSTTRRTHELLQNRFPKIQTIGVEIEPSRVASAQGHASDALTFIEGGFDLHAAGVHNASVIRCLNVLRGYGVWDVKPALLEMSAALAPGGLLIEGSTDVDGKLLCVHLWRRRATRFFYEGLLCATDFGRGFSPLMFRDILPRDLRRHAAPGEPVYEWLTTWEGIVRERRDAVRTSLPRASTDNAKLFVESTDELAKRNTDTRLTPHPGTVIWQPERPSTRPEVLCPDDI